MCPFTCTSSVLSAQLHGRWAFHSRGTVTWLVQHGIAQHCSRSSERDLQFTWLSNQFSPFKFTINWVCYESELQRSPCWWHCIDYCILILHVFSQSFLLFLIYIFFLAAVFFSLFCIVGSGYSPLEDDEDVYARNRYKGECFAYVLRISWLLRESFVLFLFMDYKILVIQFHGFPHGFLDQDLISAFLTMEIKRSTDHHSFMHLSK